MFIQNTNNDLLRYYLFKNKLSTAEEIPYLPRTVLNGSLSGSSLIEAICKGTTVTSSDCLAVLESLGIVIQENLSQGRSVNLGFLSLKPSVTGTFVSPLEPFQRDKHRIQVRISASSGLVKMVNLKASPARIQATKSEPILTSWENYSSGIPNEISVGDLVEFRGAKLKFDKIELTQGLFFLKPDGSEIRATEYSKVTGNSITCKIPEGFAPEESVRVQVRALFGNSLRSGELDDPILVR